MADFTRATPNDGETFDAVASRIGVELSKGGGYYKLVKAEEISDKKHLVLFMLDEDNGDGKYVAGTTLVREKLGWASKGDISAKPDKLPNGAELFVESTSVSRELVGGNDVLFRTAAKTDGEVTVEVHGAKKRKSDEISGDDEEEEEEEEEEQAAEEKADDMVHWSRLIFSLKYGVESLDEKDLVKGAEGSRRPEYCDQPVPNELVGKAMAKVNEALRGVVKWEETESKKNKVGREVHCRYQWQSQDEKGGLSCRLLYVYCEGANFMALQMVHKDDKFGLVCGNCNGHPFCHSPHFKYCNSDGSSNDKLLAEDAISPELVLTKLRRDTGLHCADSEH